MKKRGNKWQARILNAVGLDVMGERYTTLTYIYLFYLIFSTIESVFVNTLLHRISGDMLYVIIYRGMFYISSAIFMNVAAIISQRSSPIFVLRLGAIFYLLSYVGLVFGMNYMEQMRFIIPVLSGCGSAFYWSGHNSLVVGYTTQSTRDLGMGIIGMASGIITLIIPVITGFVISLMPGAWGYQVMFTVGMIFVVILLYFARRLVPIKTSGAKKASEFRLAIQLLRKRKSFRLMMSYEIIRGVRDGVFAFILNMMLFEIVADEGLTGMNTFLTGMMAIIGSWVYGRFVLPHLRSKAISLSATIILVFSSVLFWKMNVPTLMLFTVINAFFQLFFTNSANNTSYDVTEQSPAARRSNREMYGLREIAISFGRIIGLIIVYFIPKTQFYYALIIVILTATQYINSFLIHRAMDLLEQKADRQVKTV